MDWRKMRKLLVIGAIVFLVVIFFFAAKSFGTKVSPENYYIWGVDPYQNPTFIIPDGYVPTGVIIRINGLTQLLDSPFDVMHIHLMNQYKTGWISKVDTGTGDDFNNPSQGGASSLPPDNPFLFTYTDLAVGKENVVINLGTIDDPASYVWKVFKKPFVMSLCNGSTITWTSSLLIFMDSIGVANNPGTGIGFDPDGIAGFTFDSVTMEVTIETYQTGSTYDKKIFIVRMNIPPVL